MFDRILLFGVAVLGVGAFVATSQPDAAGTETINTLTSEAADTDSDWYAGDHTLTREWDGHFYADALVDGANVRMLVDTGASVIALTREDAAAIGLEWSEDDIKRIGTGASGAVFGVHATLDEVEIGGLVRSNVAAVIIPEGLETSLLGQSYLSQIGNVAIEGDSMVLGSG